jgi:hypothetical protein
MLSFDQSYIKPEEIQHSASIQSAIRYQRQSADKTVLKPTLEVVETSEPSSFSKMYQEVLDLQKD